MQLFLHWTLYWNSNSIVTFTSCAVDETCKKNAADGGTLTHVLPLATLLIVSAFHKPIMEVWAEPSEVSRGFALLRGKAHSSQIPDFGVMGV
jgi:hypothetical protein